MSSEENVNPLIRLWRDHAPDSFKEMMKPVYKKYISEYRERKCSFGNENPDKVFYVIRNLTLAQGILNNWIETVRKVEYAFSRGYIPIVDFKNYFQPTLQDECNKNRENAWDYYFNQPQTDYSLEEIYRSKHVILSYGQDVQSREKWPLYTDGDLCRKYYKLFKENIGLKKSLLDEYEKLDAKYFPAGGKVLGISMRRALEWGCRNNDPFYVNEKMHHPKSTVESTIEDMEKYMEQFGCGYFFFACDDYEANELIKERFREKMICLDRKRIHYFENGEPRPREEVYRLDEFSGDQFPKITLAKEYLAETWLLSKCSSMVGIETSSCVMARIMNGDSFENVV